MPAAAAAAVGPHSSLKRNVPGDYKHITEGSGALEEGGTGEGEDLERTRAGEENGKGTTPSLHSPLSGTVFLRLQPVAFTREIPASPAEFT
ncbi:hypothetical protein CONPUDRAFT_160550 [Coniophora puteana RWD-64-598 SS2]|uniref:Uncharacterized protein n=1 Tax=Coniophora puteana (strain RWD-64-598) TaxID=741705 RepID=R7SDG8_CONPW|nr:uncharacterized protein CONPUDRAFT_160550 [Coniophora puteana RWD-64-598 SS2]XP_007775889.1 uncharacterized protein CONPUDRAFT_160555 [Coniophora puteana RWD-64-598 SS2]EIW73925.1 hypothetical protein CONPUDRAFT_160555 [Coniophora puteana RWD-64-598 SS2]EIW73935.1 hypothetical protein CONPUDRAFT_160550 [Coniophora puteana RWD-64-598 SS2]